MIITVDQHDLEKIIDQFITPLFATKSIFILYGPMGAGKTTLVKEILKQFGIKQTVVSPTFGYVNTYQSPHGYLFHHFDLYRLGSLDEFMAAGFDEFFSIPNSKHLIEWPALLEPLFNNQQHKNIVQKIVLSHTLESPTKRMLEIKI